MNVTILSAATGFFSFAFEVITSADMQTMELGPERSAKFSSSELPR